MAKAEIELKVNLTQLKRTGDLLDELSAIGLAQELHHEPLDELEDKSS